MRTTVQAEHCTSEAASTLSALVIGLVFVVADGAMLIRLGYGVTLQPRITRLHLKENRGERIYIPKKNQGTAFTSGREITPPRAGYVSELSQE